MSTNQNQLNFSKMHGLGNDFMVIDAINQQVDLKPEQIRRWSDRHFGIGFDQLLLVEAPSNEQVKFKYRIFNADGDEVEQCGNGARCFAKFVLDNNLCEAGKIPVETNTGNIVLEANADGSITVDMGAPILEPADIPFISSTRSIHYTIPVNGEELQLGAISMGNPHGVLLVDSFDDAQVQSIGQALQNHPAFPQQVNVGFLQIIDKNQAKLRVYERGVGETLACGTGACAAVVYGYLSGVLSDAVKIQLPGGELSIQWAGEGHSVLMTGPAETVYQGTLDY